MELTKLAQIIEDQKHFLKQVITCTNLMCLYDTNPEKFKEVISPKFYKYYKKTYHVDPYSDVEIFWEFCDWVSSILTRYCETKYFPVYKINKGTIQYIDYTTKKKNAILGDNAFHYISQQLGFAIGHVEQKRTNPKKSNVSKNNKR